MKLSTKGRYAVMAMTDLAMTSSGRPVALADIAKRQEISLSYLEQLFAKLRRNGLVKSVRGPGGGYLLARGADAMAISDIILAVDEPIRATRCTPGAPMGCTGLSSRCMTHGLWEALGKSIQGFLGSVTLAAVCAGKIPGQDEHGQCVAHGDAHAQIHQAHAHGLSLAGTGGVSGGATLAAARSRVAE